MVFWSLRDVAAASQWMEMAFPQHPAELANIYEEIAKKAQRGDAAKPPASLAAAMKDHEAIPEPEKLNPESLPVVVWARANSTWITAIEATAGDAKLSGLLHSQWSRSAPAAWLAWMKEHPESGLDPDGTPKQRQARLFQVLESILPGFGSQRARHETGKLLDEAISLIKEHTPNCKFPPSVWFERNFAYWAELQPTAASQWVKSHLDEPWIDPVIACLATTVVQDDPPAAMIWTSKIQDPKLRTKAEQEALTIWKRLDPTAASQWQADHHGSGL